MQAMEVESSVFRGTKYDMCLCHVFVTRNTFLREFLRPVPLHTNVCSIEPAEGPAKPIFAQSLPLEELLRVLNVLNVEEATRSSKRKVIRICCGVSVTVR